MFAFTLALVDSENMNGPLPGSAGDERIDGEAGAVAKEEERKKCRR